jgi:hypothetical protein
MPFRLRPAFVLFCLCGASLLFGCTTLQHYSGPEQPKANTALLKTTVSWLSITDASVEIRNIDGKAIGRYTRSIELLPGIHELDVVCYWFQEGALQPRYTGLQVSVLPNKIYQLFSIPRSSGCEVGVEESVGGR